MKRSELNKFIREQIISVLSEATDEEIKNQEEYNKELEKTIQLKKEAGIEEQEDEPTSGDLKKTKGLAKAKEELGYEPKVRFWEGLERTVKWWGLK